MELSKFIDHDTSCPICGNQLTLFVQCLDSMCFKGTKFPSGDFSFDQFRCIDGKFDTTAAFSLIKGEKDYEFEIHSSELNIQSRKWSMYFYYICNDNAFKDRGQEYDISVYEACHYRSTPTWEFKKTANNTWALGNADPQDEELIQRNETFTYNITSNDLEKVYILELDYKSKETKFWHYAVTEEQSKEENYQPTLFEKTMPLLTVRPKFEDKEKMINRFDSWVLIS